MADTNAESPSTSLVPIQPGSYPPPLEPDVVHPTTLTGNELFGSGNLKLLTLFFLFKELLQNTPSPDVRRIAELNAIRRLMLYVDEAEAEEQVAAVLKLVGRRSSPLDNMF